MASNTTLPDHVHSSINHSLTPVTPHRHKHRNSAVAVAFHRKKRSGICSPVNFREGFVKNEVSARKLAAGLWQLRFLEVSGGDAVIDDGPFRSSKSKLVNGNVSYKNCEEKFNVTKDKKRRPVTILRSRNGLLCELEAFLPLIKSSKERETKWNPSLNEVSNEFTIVHRKKLQDRKLACDRHDSIVTVLLEELLRSQRSINKLKAAQNSSKEKLKQFLQNLEDEKVLWKCKQYKNIETMLHELKDKLTREKRSRVRMEILNTKLARELDVANRFRANYEKEKRERELTEEVCDKLVKKIEKDKAKLEKIMMESMKLYKEVEEEREMMQMAEQWREERVQMKLTDAKNVLEDKYNEMVNLIAHLQMFLKSRGDEVNKNEIEDARLIEQAVGSVNIEQILKLSCNFLKSEEDDVFPIYEELNASDRMMKIDSIEGSLKQLELLEQGNSRDNIDPHIITRGMKCIEWPKVIPKTNSKVIPLEERVKSQKSQLQNILKPKAF